MHNCQSRSRSSHLLLLCKRGWTSDTEVILSFVSEIICLPQGCRNPVLKGRHPTGFSDLPCWHLFHLGSPWWKPNPGWIAAFKDWAPMPLVYLDGLRSPVLSDDIHKVSIALFSEVFSTQLDRTQVDQCRVVHSSTSCSRSCSKA